MGSGTSPKITSDSVPGLKLRTQDIDRLLTTTMADYDFRSLSPHDFELLCRDLLQKALGLQLESFTAGPDSGVDFRHRTATHTLIVQCKHYADSGFDALSRVLVRKERHKVDLLQPSRYLLATSVGLTPLRKEDLLSILAPYCVASEDILGKDDLNNLLTSFEDIERKHFKLWLTSATVLERVLHAGIFSDSASHLDRVRLRLSRYVPNPSFDRAQALLEKSHFCIVARIPGIGKTALAEVLLADLVDRQGFTAFRIAHDVSELRAIKNVKSKQVFYFDDFLGKTALDKLERNEDQHIVDLMDEVAANPNWRFILTTREYVLNMAKRRYESFAHPPLDFQLCIINVGDYTWPVRAKILYNHIYFSDLPKVYKLALLQERGYERILGHRNYNPRVIEYMTRRTHAETVAPTLYLKEFVDSLDNPARIWDHAFRHQISEAARDLLFVLSTLRDEVGLEKLEDAFWKFHRFRQQRFRFPGSAGDWRDSLKELDGNFIKTTRVGSDIVVSFHNPSIRDFMEGFLEGSDSDALDLLRSALFYEQYVGLWTGVRGRPYRGIDRAGDEFLWTLAANLWAPSARAVRKVNQQGETVGLSPNPPSNEIRAEFFVRAVDTLQLHSGTQLVDSILATLSEFWRRGSANREDLVRFLEMMTRRGLNDDEPHFVSARECLLMHPQTNEEFRAAATFCERYPDAVALEKRDVLRGQFLEFASDHPSRWDDDPGWLRQVASDLEYVGERLNVDTHPFTQPLIERADEIDSDRADSEPSDDHEGRWNARDSRVDDVRSMFNGLASDLQDD
jgi:hypothetical protein